jgi:hypothetical protein
MYFSLVLPWFLTFTLPFVFHFHFVASSFVIILPFFLSYFSFSLSFSLTVVFSVLVSFFNRDQYVEIYLYFSMRLRGVILSEAQGHLYICLMLQKIKAGTARFFVVCQKARLVSVPAAFISGIVRASACTAGSTPTAFLSFSFLLFQNISDNDSFQLARSQFDYLL